MGKRANPDRSFDAACRHLFRHLRDPSELRRNPLLKGYFTEILTGPGKVRSDRAAAESVRAAVRRCAERCLQTDRLQGEEAAYVRYAIVVRGDVEGTDRTHLCTELGLSVRHYSRLQRDIRRRVAVLLSAEMKAARTATVAQAPSPLDDIAMLAARGSTADALEALAPLVREGPLAAPALRLQALIHQRYEGDAASAGRALAAATSALLQAPRDSLRAQIEADVELVAIETDLGSGFYDRAIARCAAMVRTLRRVEERERWRLLRVLSFAAYGNFVMGKRDAALSSLSELLAGFGASIYAPLPERLDLVFTASVVLAEFDRHADSSRMLTEGWLVARQGSLHLDAIQLDMMHTMIVLETGAVAAAVKRFSDICEETRLQSSPNLMAQAFMYLTRAQIRSSAPNPREILGNARRAVNYARSGSAVWVHAKVAESFARLMLRDLAGAERAARAADDVAATTGNRVSRANTLRELARVAHAQGRVRDAKRAILGAIDEGYAVGRMNQTAQTLDLAAQILEDSDYRSEAAALRNARALNEPTSAFAGDWYVPESERPPLGGASNGH